MNLKPKHLKPIWNQKTILLVSLALIFAIGTGITAAWLTGYDGSKNYTFEGAFVDCNTAFTALQTSASATVQNTGNVDAYIRVKVVAHYREQLGNGYGTLHYAEPKFNSNCPCTSGTIEYSNCDCDYTFAINDTWIKGDDEYYYHKTQVPFRESTTELFNDFAIKPGTTPNDHKLRMEILAEAIQAQPDGTPVKEAWGVTLDANGNITGATGFTS